MLEILKVILLGIVEGITEWLPISSTGHMILLDQFIRLNVTDAFKEMFMVVIQFGAILAVVVLFWNRLWPFHKKDPEKEGIETIGDRSKLVMWGKILVSCVPAIIIGLPLDDWIQDHFYNYVTVALMLIIYGVLFIIVENRNRHLKPTIRSISQIDWSTALLIGAFQVLALIPGTSRSGATILGGIVLGASRKNSIGIYLLPGRSGHARRKPAENREIRSALYGDRSGLSDTGDGGRLFRVDLRHQVPAPLYPET